MEIQLKELNKEDETLIKRAVVGLNNASEILNPIFDEVRKDRNVVMAKEINQVVLKGMLANGNREDIEKLLTLCSIFSTMTEHLTSLGFIRTEKSKVE